MTSQPSDPLHPTLPPLPTSFQTLEIFCSSLDEYLAQPALLDPHIPTLFRTLLENCFALIQQLANQSQSPCISHFVVPFQAFYTLCKVRGIKRLYKYFPHQVTDLHALIRHISVVSQHENLASLWQVGYVLLHHLSVAIQVPFPLDTVLEKADVHKVVQYAREALKKRGPISIAAASFLARLLMRRGVSKLRDSLISDALKELRDGEDVTSALLLLCATFKIGDREDLKPYVRECVTYLLQLQQTVKGIQAQHQITKLSVRAALLVLLRKEAKQKYRSGGCVVFRKEKGKIVSCPRKGEEEGDDDDDDDVDEIEMPDVIEDVLEIVLLNLSARDTVVRWSAAKGIGRICGRLAVDMGRPVVSSVLEILEQQTEYGWEWGMQGGCLAIAELIRRKCIVMGELGRVIDVVLQACRYDSKTGSGIRDAA